MTNRMDDLLAADARTEDDEVAALSKLARSHAAESRAADVVADKALRGKFRYAPSLDWLEWNDGRWDTADASKYRVREVVRQFVDTTEKEKRAEAAEAHARAEHIGADVMGRIAEADKVDAKGKPRKAADLFAEYADDDERAQLESAQGAAALAAEQADMWRNLLSNAKVTALTSLCMGMDGILTRGADFDRHLDLLNCRNGVVDLQTGELRPHDPDLLMTKQADADYVAGARHARWDQALKAVHPDLLAWLQVRLGQSITGHTPEDDSLVLALGGGENGKSAIMATVIRAAGSYAGPISHRVLLGDPGQHPTELMDLRGLRFALLEETPEEGHLDTHALKTTIGTPSITARHMRKDSVTFETTHTLWINSNYAPTVDTTDHGTWRRLKVAPFPYRFLKPGQPAEGPNDRPGDTTLKPALKQQEGIPEAALAWLVAGARQWYANDRRSLDDPAMVTSAIEQWRSQSDVAYLFACEHLVKAPGYYVTGEVMRRVFGEFLDEQGKRPWSSKTLNTRLPDAMTAAGCPPATDAGKPTRIKEGEVPSDPEPAASSGGWGLGAPPISPTLTKGSQARIWRGVRFATTAERAAGTATLRAV